MRARGGGVLSASALVAVGTSLLLAALVGLGISELGTSDNGGASSTMRTEAASVVVPGSDTKPTPVVKHSRHLTRPHGTPSYTWSSSVGQLPTTSSSTSRSTTTSRTLRSTTKTSSAPKPSPSPTPRHGNGKAKGAGNGHHKPSKH